MSNFVFTRRFWPLFGAQSLGAFADNMLRNATILAVLGAASTAVGEADFALPYGLGAYAGSIVSMGFTLPVLLFSVISGQLADKVDRHVLVRRLKLIELALMAFAALCFALGNAILLIFALFLMGTQSAFFSPVRNALMPEYYTKDELPRANGYFNAALFVALVTGLALGGYFVTREGGRVTVSLILIAAAGLGFLLSLFTPDAKAPGLEKINYNIPLMAVRLYRNTIKHRGLIYPMLGIGWFWMIGAAQLAMLPNFVGETLGAGRDAINLSLVFSAIGAGVGSIVSGIVVSKVKDGFRIAGIGVMGTIIGSILTFIISQGYVLPAEGFVSVANAPLLLVLVFTSASNGTFVVPLMAALQHRAPLASRAQIMGASNMTNGGLATFGAMAILPPLMWGMTPDMLFVVIALLQTALIIFMWRRRGAIRAHADSATISPLTTDVISPAFDGRADQNQ